MVTVLNRDLTVKQMKRIINDPEWPDSPFLAVAQRLNLTTEKFSPANKISLLSAQVTNLSKNGEEDGIHLIFQSVENDLNKLASFLFTG